MRSNFSFALRFGSLLLLGALGSQTANAQTYQPAGKKRHYTSDGKTYFRGPNYFTFGAGVSYYNGDLTSSPGDNYISPALSVGILRRMSPHWMLGAELGFVRLAAHGYVFNDYSGKPATPELISFRNSMFSLNGLVRYNLIADRNAYAGGVGGTPRVMPFLQAGLGFAVIDPQTYRGDKQSGSDQGLLKPERNDYRAFVGTIPVGAGLTFHLSDELNASLEATYYLTGSDSLDDVDYRGISSDSDSYGTVMVKLGYTL